MYPPTGHFVVALLNKQGWIQHLSYPFLNIHVSSLMCFQNRCPKIDIKMQGLLQLLLVTYCLHGLPKPRFDAVSQFKYIIHVICQYEHDK